MSNLDNALDKARADIQTLHQRITAANANDRAAAQDKLRSAAIDAQRLAASLKTIAKSQETDVKQHLNKAASSLEDAERQADVRAGADESKLKQANSAMLARVSEAVNHVSQAVASQRSAAAKLVRS